MLQSIRTSQRIGWRLLVGPALLVFMFTGHAQAQSTAFSLCRNGVAAIATCSSSLRYKTAIRPFEGGLELIKRLRPISFTWKDGGMRDLGFAAEEVEKVEPLLTFRNSNGEIEGVKYDKLSAVLFNAIKEQQAQIERQHAQISEREHQAAAQQRRIEQYTRQLGAQQRRNDQQQDLLARQPDRACRLEAIGMRHPPESGGLQAPKELIRRAEAGGCQA